VLDIAEAQAHPAHATHAQPPRPPQHLPRAETVRANAYF
jgi:hypothetical protein